MKALLEEMDWLRRRSAQNTEMWKARAAEVVNSDGKYIGYFQTASLAEYIARLHNSLLPLSNLIVQLRAKLSDRGRISQELDDD